MIVLMVCCAVPHTRVQEVPALLRRVLALEPFRARSRRLGKMVRISHQHAQYYTTDTRTIHLVAWPKALRQGQRG
jgi:hypothetical protein